MSVLRSGSAELPTHRPAPGIHLSADGDYVVILREREDRYVVANPELSSVIEWALGHREDTEPPHAGLKTAALVAHGVLEPVDGATPWQLPRPLQSGGLSDRRWVPLGGTTIVDRSSASVRAVVTATLLLRRSHRLTTAGTATLLPYLRGAAARARTRALDPHQNLVEAHVRARMLYPRQTACLAGSAALADHAWRRGLPATFVIGTQTTPFVAHAWVELGGAPISDTSEVSQVLAPIVRIGPEPC